MNQLPLETEEGIQILVSQAQSGDSGSVARLFELFSDRIFRYLRLRLSEVEIAEDLTQTVFLEMIQALPRYQPSPKAKFSTWLFQIARFRLIDHYRKHRSTVDIDEVAIQGHPNLSTDAPEFELNQTDAALAQLPEKYRTILHLRFREELEPKEIAQVMKISVMNVRVLQHRALRKLRLIIEQE